MSGNHKKDSRTGRRRGNTKSVWQSLALITQVSIQMLVPIFLCTFAGWWIDKKAGTSFWVVVFFFIGAIAGFNGVYKIIMQIVKPREKESADAQDNGKGSAK